MSLKFIEAPLYLLTMSDPSKKIEEAFLKNPTYKNLLVVIDLLESTGEEVFVVGGAVRDALLGKTPSDFDLTTSALPQKMLEVFKDHKVFTQGIEFGTVGVVINGDSFEVTTYRSDEVYTNSRSPDHLKFGTSLKQDLERRDFTINTLTFNPKTGLTDLFYGLKDMKHNILKAVGAPQKRFEEDALRILRLYRFSCNLGFEIEEETLKASLASLNKLSRLSTDRVFLEVKKTLSRKMHPKSLQIVLEKTGFEFNVFFDEDRLLNQFEKSHLIFHLLLKEKSFEKYVLEQKYKKLQEFYTKFSKLEDLELIKSSFVQFIEKEKLCEVEYHELWNVLMRINILIENVRLKKVSEEEWCDIKENTRKMHSGPKLGLELLKAKQKLIFKE